MTIRTILAATDLSARSDRAIDRAKLLKEEFAAKLRIVHVTNLPADNHPDLQSVEFQMRQATGLEPDGDEVEFAIVAGSPPLAIAQEAERDDVSLLVMGPARYNSLGDYFLGTAVDHVLRHVAKPALIVKQRANSPYTRIIAGTDFSAGSAHAILTAARMFPRAEVHIVHGWHVPFEGLQRDAYVPKEIAETAARQMEAFVKQLCEEEPNLAGVTTNLVKGGAVEALRSELKLKPDALVVIGSHGASGFRQAVLGSSTSDLLRFINADTLVVSTKGVD